MLDLNDCNLSGSNNNTVLHISGSANVTIQDGSIGGNGTISAVRTYEESVFVRDGVITMSGGALTIAGGSVSASGKYARGIHITDGTLAVSGGTVSGVSGISYGMYLEGTDVNVTISDEGETSGYTGVMIRLGCLTMEDGGSVIGTNYGVSLAGVTTNNRSGSATINGGVITGNSSGIYVAAQTATVTIHGGTVSGSSQDGIFAYEGTTNIIGGSVFGGTCDLFKGEKAIVTLGVSEDKEEGTSFPGGITVSGTTLMDILDHEVSYWIGDEKQVLTTGQTTILTDSNHPVTIKSECKHTNGSYTDNGDSHTFVCDACSNAVTELHSFTRELVDAKYLEHPATSTEAAVFCKSCVCGAASDAHTFVYGTVKNRLIVDSAELDAQTSVWVDGREFLIQQDGNACYVDLPDGNAKTMTVYTYGTSGEKQYPIGMKVWTLSNIYGFYTASRAEALDDMLQYEGCSIRIDGVQGIRMITSVEQADKKALTEDGLAGYTLKEYGTAIAWANKLSETKPLVLGKSYVNHNYAYKKGVADPIYDNSDGRIHYTNVIVGFTMKQCTKDIAMRPYMILEDAAGNEITLYGGIVERSIRYIASEILDLNIYKPDSAEYEYLQTILAGSSATN